MIVGPMKPGLSEVARLRYLTYLGIISLAWSSLHIAILLIGLGSVVLVVSLSVMFGTWPRWFASWSHFRDCAWVVASTGLSSLLALAGWRTLRDDTSGIRLHQTWAWLGLGFDAVCMLGSGGKMTLAGPIYAVLVLFCTSRPQVQDYVRSRIGDEGGKPYVEDDEGF